MKISVTFLSLALLFPSLIRAADDAPAQKPEAIAQAVAAKPADAAQILKAAFESAPGQIAEVVKAVVAASPETAPLALELAIEKLGAQLAPAAKAQLAATLTQTTLEAAVPTQSAPEAKTKLATAIVAAAERAVPAAQGMIHEAAARAVPSFRPTPRAFPPQRAPIVVSPSS